MLKIDGRSELNPTSKIHRKIIRILSRYTKLCQQFLIGVFKKILKKLQNDPEKFLQSFLPSRKMASFKFSVFCLKKIQILN
jgi:hypothetical protein